MTKLNIVQSVKRILYNGKLGVFLAFFMLALIVWLMNKLSHNYINTIEYPVELYSTKHKQQIFEQTTGMLTVQLKMSGFDILKSRVYKAPVLRIGIDDDRYSKQKSRSNTFFVLSSSITDAVAEQLGENHSVVGISPDTLFFRIKRLKEKKVPVVAQLELKLEKEYMIRGGLRLSPDSVTVSGDSATLSKIASVNTKPKLIEKVMQPVQGNLDIVLQPINTAYISPTKVSYYADVVRYTEGSLKVPIQIQNIPVGTELMLLPAEVEVKYRTAIADFDSVIPTQLLLAVNYNDIQQNDTNKLLKVQVVQQPKSMLEVTLSHPFVEFIIHKNGHD